MAGISAAERLGALVDGASRTPGSASTLWKTYVAHIVTDARDLAFHPHTEAQIIRLSELEGSGWKTRANQLRRAIKAVRDAEKAKFRTAGPDDEKIEPEVWEQLTLTKSEPPYPKPTLRNATLILEHDSRWRGRVQLNAFSGQVEVDREGLTDTVTSGISIWLDEHYGVDLSSAKVDEAIRWVSCNHEYHPVRRYLGSLKWDGKARLDGLLCDYFGAMETTLNAEIGRKFMVAAVARVKQPGCKVDTVMTLVGAQGQGKSTAIGILGGHWYSDTDIDPHGKDAYQQISGVWLYEVAEVEKWNGRRDQSVIKAFLSSQKDRYRPPYGRNTIESLRQVVFVATTNTVEFLADHTGSRRWWPVKIGVDGPIDLGALREDRDQLWAEALYAYNQGENWYLDKEQSAVLADESDEHQSADPWLDKASIWLETRGHEAYTSADLLNDAIGLTADKQQRRHSNRLAAVMRDLGWESTREPKGCVPRRRLWRKVQVEA